MQMQQLLTWAELLGERTCAVGSAEVAREDNRERLVACLTGSLPWRPALLRSHSRNHRNSSHLSAFKTLRRAAPNQSRDTRALSGLRSIGNSGGLVDGG